MSLNTKFNRIIKNICEEKGIKYTLLSRDWITMLEYNGKTRFISGFQFDLNDHALGCVMDDKYALYDVLREKDIPVAEHHILFKDTNNYEYAEGYNSKDLVRNFFNEHKEIVLKSNTGSCGTGVYKITDKNQLEEVLDKLLSNNHSISYCPLYNIKNEYRMIILNGEIQLMYKKIKPAVVGNGKNTIKELLLDFNTPYFKDKLEDEKYNEILPKGEVFEYDWRFNLSRGAAISTQIEDYKRQKIVEIKNEICKEFHIGFASIDVIELEDEFKVLELNSGVMTENIIELLDNGEEFVKYIYSNAIDKMFE